MKAYLEDAIYSMSEDIENQKALMIQAALIEKGIDLDFNAMLKNPPRFTRLNAEYHTTDTELYYYDDGSHNGLFIIGFRGHGVKHTELTDRKAVKVSFEYSVIHEEPEWNKKHKAI